MQWSSRLAALDLHHGLDLTARTDVVLAYFATQLQAAYNAGVAAAADEIQPRGEPSDWTNHAHIKHDAAKLIRALVA